MREHAPVGSDGDFFNKASRILFNTIGSPIGTGSCLPTVDELESLTEYAFKTRVGLLFLEECVRKGVRLGPRSAELYESLSKRRLATDSVVVKLARTLDQVAKGEWTLFKSLKPFASTPNDTDWFPFDPKRHKSLCDHLTASGDFKLLEVAPRQTTLIEIGGRDVADTTKRGGVYYVDCYRYPAADYFIYLDPRRLRGQVRTVMLNGYPVPTLSPEAELAAILFHNVFPERSFSPESYYLIKSYLDLIEESHGLDSFAAFCRDQHVAYPAAHNLALAGTIDRYFFEKDDRLDHLLKAMGYEGLEVQGFNPSGRYPYEIPNRIFWSSFLRKQRDRTSLISTGVQLLHMLNPIFLIDVFKIIWRRSIRGGVYEQN